MGWSKRKIVIGTFPSLTYQLGNPLASGNATLQAGLAQSHGGDYAFALALVAAIGVIAVAALADFSGIKFAGAAPHPAE